MARGRRGVTSLAFWHDTKTAKPTAFRVAIRSRDFCKHKKLPFAKIDSSTPCLTYSAGAFFIVWDPLPSFFFPSHDICKSQWEFFCPLPSRFSAEEGSFILYTRVGPFKSFIPSLTGMHFLAIQIVKISKDIFFLVTF